MFEAGDKVRKKANHDFHGSVYIGGPRRTIVVNKYGRDVVYKTDELELVPMEAPPKEKIESKKTVRVRIAVAMDSEGHYYATGFDESRDDDIRDAVMSEFYGGDEAPYSIRYIEADIPLPEPTTIEGEVKP